MTWQLLTRLALIKTELHLFCLAVSFYTRLPCPLDLDYAQLPQATRYLPVIGWLVGGISAAVFYFAALLWSTPLAVLLALGVGVLVTGAFHEYGLADVCDGFGGGWQKTQILDIMKDSRVGTYGALALLFALLLKLTALVSLPASAIPAVLLSAHSVSRFAPLWLMRRYDYARVSDSKMAAAVYRPCALDLVFAGVCAVLPLLFLPALCFWTVLPMTGATCWLGHYFQRHIGGYTGDCLGAVQQISETVFYLAVGALWTFI